MGGLVGSWPGDHMEMQIGLSRAAALCLACNKRELSRKNKTQTEPMVQGGALGANNASEGGWGEAMAKEIVEADAWGL